MFKIKYHIYLFQLENYDIARYFKLSLKSLFREKPLRQSIVWTSKLRVLSILSFVIFAIIYLIFASLSYGLTHNFFIHVLSLVIFLLFSYYFYFVYLILSSIFLYPLDAYLKNRIINKAKHKLSNFKNLKVIGIAGSYGKTTTKEILFDILSKKFKVLKTPSNINTPLGISELINEKLTADTEVFIVEMGEYKKAISRKSAR